MALRVLDTDKVSLKSGFDKYLSTDEQGKVQGRSDAIGVREQWEPIFQDVGKTDNNRLSRNVDWQILFRMYASMKIYMQELSTRISIKMTILLQRS